MKYISKGIWFKAGTEAILEEDLGPDINSGIYRGIYVVGGCEPSGYDNFWYDKGYKIGDEVEMSELCSHEEFDVVE